MSLDKQNMSTHQDNVHPSVGLIISGALIVLILLIGFQILRKNPSLNNEVIQLNRIETAREIAHSISGKGNPTQAQIFYRTIQAGLRQPHLFPFQPQWSGETYDPDMKVGSETMEKLKQHVMLRHFYSCDARLTPEFRHLSDLLTDWDIQQTPSTLMQLFDSVRATELVRESMVENQELIHPTTQKELLEQIQKDKIHLGRMVIEMLGIKNPEFINELFEIRPKIGFGKPDTRIKPGEHLLIY